MEACCNCQTEERGRKGDETHCVRLHPIPLQPGFDILPVITTHAEIKQLINMWRKQSRNVDIWCSINSFICTEHLFFQTARAAQESGCMCPYSLAIHAVHVCGVKPRRKKVHFVRSSLHTFEE